MYILWMVRKNRDETSLSSVKRRLDRLKKQTNVFINYSEINNMDLKNSIKGIVDSSYKLLERISECDKKNIETFNSYIINPMLEQIKMYNKRFKNFMENYLFGEWLLVDLYIHYNSEILKFELKNSLTDCRYRYPRCPHVNKPVEHLLYVKANVYLKEKDNGSLLFLICDECNDFMDYCKEKYKNYWTGSNKCIGTLGYIDNKPLNFSMY